MAEHVQIVWAQYAHAHMSSSERTNYACEAHADHIVRREPSIECDRIMCVCVFVCSRVCACIYVRYEKMRNVERNARCVCVGFGFVSVQTHTHTHNMIIICTWQMMITQVVESERLPASLGPNACSQHPIHMSQVHNNGKTHPTTTPGTETTRS